MRRLIGKKDRSAFYGYISHKRINHEFDAYIEG